MEEHKKPENTTKSETKKQNQDFPNIPASSTKKSPPEINKDDIKKSSKLNKDGRTENTEQNKDGN